MPYVHVQTSVALTDSRKKEFYDSLVRLMPILPGKTVNNTMVCLECGDMYMRGDAQPLAFVDVRLFKPSPEAAKAEFVSALTALLGGIGVAQNGVYMNLIEMSSWGANGGLSS